VQLEPAVRPKRVEACKEAAVLLGLEACLQMAASLELLPVELVPVVSAEWPQAERGLAVRSMAAPGETSALAAALVQVQVVCPAAVGRRR